MLIHSFVDLLRTYISYRAKDRDELLAWQQRYKEVFSTESGKLVLADMMKRNFVWDSSFVAGDPYMSALQEGQRRTVLSIFRLIERDPNELTQHADAGTDT